MKFIRYSKFRRFDVSGVDLGGLMDALSNQMLDSGYNEDYWWTRERNEPDDSLDALRKAILQALLEQEVLSEQDVRQMLEDNGNKFKGSLLEELINQLIERLVTQTSVQSPARISFFRFVVSTAALKSGSSQEFMVVRSISGTPGSTSRSSGLVPVMPCLTYTVLSTTGSAKVVATRPSMVTCSSSSAWSTEPTPAYCSGW